MNLSTNRLELEQLSGSHAPQLFDLLQSSELYNYISDFPPSDIEALVVRYERLSLGVSPNGEERWLNWAIKLRNNSVYIGYVQATVLNTGFATIAYLIASDYWRQGYAKEATAKMIEYLKGTYNLLGLQATVDPENIPSIKLLTSLGFARSGIRKQAVCMGGVWHDEWDYQLVFSS